MNSVGREYIIDKRYSDFEALHLKLKETARNYGFKDFPSKLSAEKKKA